jgi:hypothetical protein
MSTARTTAPARDGLLRFAMRLDATGVGLVGIPFVALAGQLESLTGVPWTWDLGLGIFFLAYGAVFYPLSGRANVKPGGIAIVIANALFTVFFWGLAVASGWPLTPWGYALLIGGGLYTAVIGAVQYAGLRRL